MTSPAETPADAVRFEHVGLVLGENRILDDVCARVPRGKFTAIVGPNGAGKTTLTLAILGQIRHTGKILFPGLDEAGRRPRFGFVPQRLVFDRDIPMTVMDYLLSGLQRMPLFLGHIKRHVDRIMQYLEEVECTRLADHAFGALSGGEIQRVLLAQALLQEPDILILDEPTSGVDFKGGQICCELLRRVREKRGFTQIMISHDLATVTAHADHVICLNHKVFGEGEPRVALTHQVLSAPFGAARTAINEEPAKSAAGYDGLIPSTGSGSEGLCPWDFISLVDPTRHPVSFSRRLPIYISNTTKTPTRSACPNPDRYTDDPAAYSIRSR